MLVPRLITYLWYCLLDQNCAPSAIGTTQVALNHRLIIQHRSFNSLSILRKVCRCALVYSRCLWNILLPRCHLKYCLSWFCIQALFCVVSLGVRAFGFVGHTQACLGDLWLSRTWPRFIYSDAISVRDAASSPACLLTARVAKTVGWLPCRSVLLVSSLCLWLSLSVRLFPG